MIPIGIKLMEDYTDNLRNRLEALEKQEVLVGVTEQEGIHEPSGMSYVDLLKLHSAGVPSMNIPSRDVAEWTLLTYTKHKELKQDLTKYLDHIDRRQPPVPTKEVVKRWSESMWRQGYDMFGNLNYLEGNAERTIDLKGFDSPLIETGSLRDSWSIYINGVKVK
ncbi:putative coil containing protein [Vibrio phage 424E50-1]|nr:putative coil containing protein [Vibrio phage 424E50-1]CAH9012613.1 putative coil containing protein [Vibrio phage 501E54-1]